jgi:signal transduction histidine kinase
VGIKRKQLDDLFKFLQKKTTTKSAKYSGGMGLGLTVAKAVSKALGGDCWVQSQECQGSTFTFTVRNGGHKGHL